MNYLNTTLLESMLVRVELQKKSPWCDWAGLSPLWPDCLSGGGTPTSTAYSKISSTARVGTTIKRHRWRLFWECTAMPTATSAMRKRESRLMERKADRISANIEISRPQSWRTARSPSRNARDAKMLVPKVHRWAQPYMSYISTIKLSHKGNLNSNHCRMSCLCSELGQGR